MSILKEKKQNDFFYLFMFNPRYAFLEPLKALLEKALEFYPPEEIERLTMRRKRPRSKDKPL